ncbi:MAG: NADH-quinone oxidoreductase subunit NuoF [candidate division FCPU426 bacterium]
MATPLYLTKNFKNPAAASYDGYVAGGGYAGLKKALSMAPADIIEEVKKANLRGRGGAGFPAGVKWGFLPKTDGPKYMCVNADEGEPGTFKDGPLMELDPHQMLEGIAIACYALDIHTAYVYIRGEFYKAYRAVENAIDECYAKGIFGKGMMGSSFALECRPHPGAGAYICGEETGLISSLEGKKGFPKLKPPFPAIKGLFGKPTIVNNVETLACVPHIMTLGAEAWAALGCEKNGGTKLYCVSGQISRPGLYELPHSVTLKELLYDHCGGPLPGRTIKAVIPGGSSAKILKAPDEIDVRMDFDSLGKAGSMLGSAAVIVMDDSTSLVRALDNLLRFYAHESCGQCTPCREGTRWISKLIHDIADGRGESGDLDKILDILTNMVGNTICVLADAAAFPAESFIKKFRPEFEEYVRRGKRMSITGWKEEAPVIGAGAH